MGCALTGWGVRVSGGALWKSEDCWDLVSVQWGVCVGDSGRLQAPWGPLHLHPHPCVTGLPSACVGRSVPRSFQSPPQVWLPNQRLPCCTLCKRQPTF